MKILLKEIDGDSDPEIRCRMLGFKEFCVYVYDPAQRRKALNLQQEERPFEQADITNRCQRADL